MNTSNPLRLTAAIGASVAALMLFNYAPAAAAEAGPRERGAVQAAERSLPDSAIEAAGAYSSYMRAAGEIDPRFTDGASVARSLKVGAAYESKQLARGAVAFAAVVALQDERFTRAVVEAAERHGGAEAFAAKLVENPYWAVSVPGAERTGMVMASALGAEGERVRQVGMRVKMAAYDVQHQAWSKADVSGRPQRLADAKALSAKPLRAGPEDLALGLAAVGDPRAVRLPVSLGKPEVAPLVARGLAVAALAALGQADEAKVEQLSNDPECNTCLRMAKLNLFQCLAVSKPWYEDVFCLGQHVLIDTGDCVYAASGSPKRTVAALSLPAGRREE